jgi:hypothetical protein
VQAFGDRLHLRVRAGSGNRVISRVTKSIRDRQAVIYSIDAVQPSLEDVFISLLEVDA